MIRSYLTALLTVLFILFCGVPSQAGVVAVSDSDEVNSINNRINQLSAGDTLIFLPGIYKGPFSLNGVNGQPNLPIVITGIANDPEMATIDGRSEPGMGLLHNAFQLQDCSWIVIKGFRIHNCWTDIITAVDVSYLSVKQCDVVGGKRLLYTKGWKSHHFLVENCTWEQDIRVWTHDDGYSWEELHHGVYRHFNGSIFQGDRISGVFVLRNNKISNTFNAFRLSPVGEGQIDLLACSNGDIYNNLIINTSDNVLEPEVYCYNLYFYHNRLINGHAFISVTEVGGGPIYLYGNTGLSESDCEDGWAIYKISNRERSMSEPFYIFNNSWYVDYNITGRRMGWWNDHVVHFNNAYFFEGVDTFGLFSTGDDSYYNNDCSSAVFPDFFKKRGFESDGIEGDALFKNPEGNDFRLQDVSPCFDSGQLYEGLVMEYEGSAPDIGAYEGNMPVMGPAFKFSMPGVKIPFKEHPRITRYELAGKRLILWFSMPMDSKQMIQRMPVLKTENMSIQAKLNSVENDGYCFRFTLEKEVDPEAELLLVLSQWPSGMNGMMMTSWASALKVSVNQ
jgi:hypothetical protein